MQLSRKATQREECARAWWCAHTRCDGETVRRHVWRARAAESEAREAAETQKHRAEQAGAVTLILSGTASQVMFSKGDSKTDVWDLVDAYKNKTS